MHMTPFQFSAYALVTNYSSNGTIEKELTEISCQVLPKAKDLGTPFAIAQPHCKLNQMTRPSVHHLCPKYHALFLGYTCTFHSTFNLVHNASV